MQFFNADNILKTKNLDDLLNLSFMQPWLYQGLYTADVTGRIVKVCDYAVWMEDKLLLIQNSYVEVKVVDKATKQRLQEKRKQAIYQAHKGVMQTIECIQAKKTIFSSSEGKHAIHFPENITIFSLCVTDLKVIKSGKRMYVTHGYDSNYFLEECVLDFDDDMYALQVFSVKDFAQIIHKLETFPDFTDFMCFHKQKLVSGEPFEKEANVLQEYISSAAVFASARKIDEHLVKQKLRPSISTQLQVTTTKKHEETFKSIDDIAKFWIQILAVYASQIPPEAFSKHLEITEGGNKYQDLLNALMNESIYSRFALCQCIYDYLHAPIEHQENGYMVHMRSYTNPLRHYAFLFYSQDEKSPHHRNKAKDKLKNVAAGINYHEQDPLLKEIIIIGLAQNTAKTGVMQEGDNLQTDIYYTKGKVVDKQLMNPQGAVEHTPQSLKGQLQSQVTQKNTQKNSSTYGANNMQQKDDASRVATKQTGIKKHQLKQTQASHANELVKIIPPTSRNADCPCGSGKKYRKCHGALKDYTSLKN